MHGRSLFGTSYPVLGLGLRLSLLEIHIKNLVMVTGVVMCLVRNRGRDRALFTIVTDLRLVSYPHPSEDWPDSPSHSFLAGAVMMVISILGANDLTGAGFTC